MRCTLARQLLVIIVFLQGIIGYAAEFKIGAGKADITGPAADRGMMGYGDPAQITKGIHTALKSRAFVLEDPASQRVIGLVVVDLAMISHAIKA